jgi:sugar phosphate isomerase/epimerase
MLCAINNFHHPSWIEKDKHYRELRIRHTLNCIDLAAKLGVRTISTEPGGPVNGMPRETALEIFMEGLSRVVPYAIEKGVVVLIEPEPGLLIETSDQFVSFIDQFGHKGMGLNFDVGHFYCVGEDPAAKIKELKNYIFHFHLEDIPESREHRHILLGEGGIDIPGVLNAIEAIGYQDFVTVELYPYQDSAPETARKARNYLRKVCGYG